MQRVTGVLFVALVGVLLWVTGSVRGDGAKPKPDAGPEPDFTGKVLVIYGKSPNGGGVLQDAALKRLGDRCFLVGKTMSRDGSESAWVGVTAWIAMDDVRE